MSKYKFSAALTVVFLVNLIELIKEGFDWLSFVAVVLCAVCVVWDIVIRRASRGNSKE